MEFKLVLNEASEVLELLKLKLYPKLWEYYDPKSCQHHLPSITSKMFLVSQIVWNSNNRVLQGAPLKFSVRVVLMKLKVLW